MKKNKKGFTIIELLIAIAILLSILFIAILSLSKASTRKKEEAYQKVEEQIITAAEEFAASNEYILKDKVKKNGDKTTITLKQLINKNLINKVTDPRTGKAINECTEIEFTYKNNSFKITGVNTNVDDTNCNETESEKVLAAEPTFKKDNSSGNTYTPGTWTNTNVYTNLENKGTAEIATKQYSLNDGNYQNISNDGITISSENTTNIKYKYCDSSNNCKETDNYIIRIDTTPPVCGTVAEPNGLDYSYNLSNKLKSVKLSATDELSGIDGESYHIFEGNDLKYGDNVTYEHTFKDKAGNSSACSATVTYKNEDDKVLGATPVFKKGSSSGSEYSTGTWTNANVYTNLENIGTAEIVTKQYSLDGGNYQNLSDKGLIISKNGITNIRYKYCDSSNKCEETSTYTIKIDTEAPVCDAASVLPNGKNYTYVGSKPTITLNAHDYVGGSGLNGESSKTIPSSEITEGTNTYERTFTDKVGNSRTCSVSVSYKSEEDKVLAAEPIFKKESSSGDKYYSGSWTNKSVYTNLENTGTAEIATKQYSLNGGSYQYILNTGIIISSEGTTYIKYKYCDSSNNCEETDTYTIMIDKTPPDCEYSVESDYPSEMVNGWYNNATGQPYVSLSANDNENGSGINNDASILDYGLAQPGTKDYFSIVHDNAGNVKNCTLTVKYDDEAPSFSTVLKKKSSTGSTYIAGDWYNDNVYANVTNAASTYSKISEKSYSINDSTTYYSLSSSGTTRTETERIKFRVCNEAGNCTISDNSQINIDKVAPRCSYSTDRSASSTGWYNKATGSPYISFESNDAGGSGIESSGTYSSTPTGSAKNGTTEYEGIAIDRAGNISYCGLVVNYDGDAPTCTSTVNGANNNNTVNGWYNIATGKPSIKFNVSDETSGPFASSISVGPSNVIEGIKTYNDIAKDLAGNTSECSVTVKYDATAPDAKMSRVTGSTTLKYEGSDSISGIKYYKLTDSSSIPTSWTTSSQSSVSGTTDGGANKTATYKYIHFKDEAGNTNYASAKIYQTCSEGKNETNTDERAYFWGSQGGNCKTQTTDGYYVRRYRFRSYKCICSIDTVANKTCGDATAVETEVHPYDSDVGDYVAKIYYRGIPKGQEACQNATNEYVDHVCSERTGKLSESNSYTGWHGYQWYFGARTGRKWETFRSAGWYHSGGCYDYDSKYQVWNENKAYENAVNQCNIACKRVTNEIDYVDETSTKCIAK